MLLPELNREDREEKEDRTQWGSLDLSSTLHSEIHLEHDEIQRYLRTFFSAKAPEIKCKCSRPSLRFIFE